MIQLFSSYAHDLIAYQNNCLVSGGPAFWIEKVFSVLPVQYALHTGGTPGLVRIEKDASGEDRWTILSTSEIPFSHVNMGDIVLISTLQQEFDLTNIKDCTNHIFIDIQWFLRGDNGTKNIFDCQRLRSRGHVYVKATREEYGYLINTLQPRCSFVLTDGGGPIEIITGEYSAMIEVTSYDFIDTIGAWDTFLANLAYHFMQVQNLEIAVSMASHYVFSFLQAKNNFL